MRAYILAQPVKASTGARWSLICIAGLFAACGAPYDAQRHNDDPYMPTSPWQPTDGDSGPGDLDPGDAGPGDSDPADAGDPDETPPPIVAEGFTLTACPDVQLPAGNTCTHSAGTEGLLISGIVLTAGEVFAPGAVAVDASGTITCVGCGCAAPSATQISCGNAVISPGLINTHDHMGWMGAQPYRASGSVRYEHRHDWRLGDPSEGEPKISSSGGASTDAKIWGELRFALSGATSINGSGSAPGLLRNLDQASQLLGLGVSPVRYETFPLGDSNGTLRADSCTYPSIDNPATVAQANAYTPHVAEGINRYAENEISCLTSSDGGGKEVLGANTAIIHGVAARASDVELFSLLGVSLIWSPRSNITLYGDTAPVTLYHRFGIPIALGTDWLPTGSMNMSRELACARSFNERYLGNYFSSQDLWRMVTVDAARALHVDPYTGVLAPGHKADIAIFARGTRQPFDAVTEAEPQDTLLVLRGGQVLVGEAGLVDALDSQCDLLDVCGANKRVCLKREVQKSLATLESSLPTSIYSLFSCGIPENEPSCHPARGPSEVQDGSSPYDGILRDDDQDGDGITDTFDNCPNIFNPVRPVDAGKQADSDGDGVGDVCDPCPLDADAEVCSLLDPNDFDGDGVDNASDNCERVANSDQEDADSDGKGNACDACPLTYNPGPAACPASIYEIKQGLLPPPANVAVRDLVVVATSTYGFFAELSPASEDYDPDLGPQYSSIFVYTGAGTNLPPRDTTVAISNAEVALYYDQLELKNATWETTTSLPPPTPTVVTVADVYGQADTPFGAASPYEGVLVTLSNAEVANAQPTPGAGDDATNEVELVGGLRIDDYAGYVLSPWPTAGTTYAAISGVIAWHNSLLKLLPRDAADIATAPPTVVGFSASLAYQRANTTGSAMPQPLYLELSGPALSATSVPVTSAAAGSVHVVGDAVSFTPGSARAEVLLAAGPEAVGPIALTAMQDAVAVASTEVRVLADDTAATLFSVSPENGSLRVGDSLTFVVRLDLPAPVGGTNVSIVAESSDTQESWYSLSANNLTIAAGKQEGSLVFTGLLAASGQLSFSDGATTLIAPVSVDARARLRLSGWQVVQQNAPRSFTLPDTEILQGDYVVITRNSTQQAFESFWGVTLGSNVLFINTADQLPSINGSETFALVDPLGNKVDGPSPSMAQDTCYQRLVPLANATSPSSWLITTDEAANATPGSDQAEATFGSGFYVSEFCDAPGAGNYIYEFVELYYAGE